MKNSIFLLIIVSAILGSCNRKAASEAEKIKSFYYQCVPDGDFGRFSRVVIINELGTCMNCNNRFASCQYADIDNDSVLYIVSSQGARIDISKYTDSARSNVVWDTMFLFNDLGISDTCTVIHLR